MASEANLSLTNFIKAKSATSTKAKACQTSMAIAGVRAGQQMAGTSAANSEAAGHAAAASTNGNSSNVTVSKVPRVAKTFRAYLPSACHRTYSCVHCRAHLANHDELISKSFQGSQGRAYLFNSVVNIGCGPAEERVLLTGERISHSRIQLCLQFPYREFET